MKPSRWPDFVLALMLATPALATPSTDAAPLCSILETLAPGDTREVVVQGVFVSSLEMQFLYDPGMDCHPNVQPAAWVVLSPSLDGSPVESELSDLLHDDGKALVTFGGKIQGPGTPGPDDPSLPVMVAYSRRVGERYGHHRAFRTQLLVDEILDFGPAPQGTDPPLLSPPEAERLRPASPQLPSYPELARRAGISGTVRLRVEVRDGEVAKVQTVSGDRLLAREACRSVESWRFETSESRTFDIVFDYRLAPLWAKSANPSVDFELPIRVQVTAPIYGW